MASTITTTTGSLKVGMKVTLGRELFEIVRELPAGEYEILPAIVPPRKERRAAKREQPQHRYGPPRRSRY